ncbi:MAG: hypothetical protein EOQ40_24480 [Mesorhizobium sp.]|nr:MAG: hypothetical protein EOQ40_24480 [Mesorhizobium sp.]
MPASERSPHGVLLSLRSIGGDYGQRRENRRETGARKYPANPDSDPSDRFSQAAADNEKPRGRFGLTRIDRRAVEGCKGARS